MSKVKCKLCKDVIDKKNSFALKVNGSKVNSYFCTTNHLQEFKELKRVEMERKEQEKIKTEQFNQLDLYIAIEILGNEKGQIVNPYLKRRVKKLAEKYDYEVIRLAFEYIKKDLDYFLRTKEFKDEQHKINYIMVVVESNINDTYKIWKRKKEIEQRQSSLDKSILHTDDFEEISTRKLTKVTNDISAFLTEDDL